ncbi:MAG: hypothetical protein HKN75_11965 [Bacteroidia bacterium]|nr:hypothetical protein [Bacteroidia bacterium]
MNAAQSICIFLVCILFVACVNEPKEVEETTEAELKEQLIKENKLFVEKENDRINSYIARHKYSMKETGTGLRYQIVEEAKGEKAKADDKVQIAFTSRIVDGEILVGEQNADTISVLIGKTEIPSGVNEAVQLLSEGEKGKFILPTHLAYGLTGDNDKVPPNAALIYNIHLLKIDRTTDKQNEKRNEQGN